MRQGMWVRGVAPVQPRIGDAERESAVSALGEHYTAGRLTLEEYDERTSRAFVARTAADLWPLFADLPPLASPPTQEAGPFGFGFAPVLLAVIALVVLSQLPWPVMLIVGWVWWSRTYRRWQRGRSGHTPPAPQTSGSWRAVRGTCS